MTNELSELGKAAVAYAEDGIAIIPLKPRDKEPYIKGGSTKATANVEQVRKHWMTHPDDNIAIVCGGVSDGLFAIDVDCHGDVDGWDTLAEFEADRPLPAAPTSITGSGGGHMLYRSGESVRNGVGSDTGIDVRGEGGYIVAPPSIHPNGNAYRWETSPLDMDIPEADANVLALVESIRPVDSDTAKLTMPAVIHEGEGRDNALYKLACSQRANNLPYETALVTVMDYNQRCCVPPMPERVVRQKVDSAYRHKPGHSEKVRMAEKAGEEGRPKRGRPRKFDHAKVARNLIEDYGACKLDGEAPAVRMDDGHYETGWSAFDKLIIDIFADCTANNRREVKTYINAIMPHKEQSPSNLIAFANGVLDIETMELRDWREDDVIANVIPHNWNPDAKCPLLDSTLKNMANGDPGVHMNLAQIAGMCMMRSNVKLQQFPVLIGTGANGKSTYIRMLKNLLGKHNISALQPKDLGSRFQKTRLLGKLANLGDDIPAGYLNDDDCSEIKKIVTGDLISTDVKGMDGFEFESYATLVFSCNDFPRVADTTDGFMRRIFPVRFGARFTRDNPDYNPDLGYELSTETAMERFAAIAVEGLNFALKNATMTTNRDCERLKSEVMEDSNTVMQWINDEMLTDEDIIGRTLESVYNDYRTWADHNGCAKRAVKSRSVSKQIVEHFDVVLGNPSKKYINGKRVSIRYYERRRQV